MLVCGTLLATLLLVACGGGERDGDEGGDAASTWTSLGLEGQDLTTILVNPVDSKVLYAATPTRLNKSVDGGVNWADIGGPQFTGPAAMDPIRPDTLVAG